MNPTDMNPDEMEELNLLRTATPLSGTPSRPPDGTEHEFHKRTNGKFHREVRSVPQPTQRPQTEHSEGIPIPVIVGVVVATALVGGFIWYKMRGSSGSSTKGIENDASYMNALRELVKEMPESTAP
jgi:hypothetical protein